MVGDKKSRISRGVEVERLIEALNDERAALSFGRVTTLNDACSRLLSTHGKVLRGRLVLASALQGPQPDVPEILKAACAIELLHLASLTHDDVIDSGTLRRGEPTVAVCDGPQAAGLVGGWLFARASELAAECGTSALEHFAVAAQQMCSGGMREMRDLFNPDRTAESYFEAAGEKTASAFAFSAGVGAELAGASIEDVEKMRRFGFAFGMAYQIWDDLMDMRAGSGESGKTPRSDFRQGVCTLPVIYAFEETPELRKGFTTIAAFRDDSAMVGLVNGSAAIERAMETIGHYEGLAVGLLDGLPSPEILHDLIDHVRRTHAGPAR